MPIQKVHAREILDSRGNPTVEVDVTTELGVFRAAVPSGASTGENEAVELRDGDNARFTGRGVQKAVENVIRVIGPAIQNMDPTHQEAIDKKMIDLDGTETKSKLGANAILGVSMAVARAGAAQSARPLYRHLNELAGKPAMVMPVPAFNVINGGVHAGNLLAFQEFFLIPTGACNFREALRFGSETYHALKSLLIEKHGINAVAVGDEGGFAPPLKDPKDALKLLVQAIDKAGHTGKIKIGSDPAASEFYIKEKNVYDLDFKDKSEDKPRHLTGDELADWWKAVVKEFPVALLEDPFHESDFESFAKLTEAIGESVEIVGDDIFVTNPKFIQKGIDKKAANSVLLKVNQIGTVTETIGAWKLAREHHWGTFVSHRSGETEDTFIADLSVGLGTGHLKTGAPARSERTSKYNQLLRIEEEAHGSIPFAGESFRTPWVVGQSH
jgi:enolase